MGWLRLNFCPPQEKQLSNGAGNRVASNIPYIALGREQRSTGVKEEGSSIARSNVRIVSPEALGAKTKSSITNGAKPATGALTNFTATGTRLMILPPRRPSSSLV